MDLEALRKEIDSIDTQLTDLFVQRMNLCAQVARYKKEHNQAVLNQGREREILRRVSARRARSWTAMPGSSSPPSLT